MSISTNFLETGLEDVAEHDSFISDRQSTGMGGIFITLSFLPVCGIPL
jgi:hypothetical protein